MKTLLVPPLRRPALWLSLLLLLLPAWVCAYSANPDLTAAGAIAALKADANASPLYGRTYNLGATGLRGWIYIDPTNIFSDPAIRNPTDVGQDGRQTAQSRQILVTVASAPGSAVLAVDDVILGAMAAGSGDVPYFTGDCRKAMGMAIGDAENTGAGTLRVKRWRAGTITDVNIPMTIMGNYSATAPYNCPKSTAILAAARTKLVNDVIATPNFYLTGNYGGAITGLALLAGVTPADANYAAVQTLLQNFARTLASAGPQTQGLDIWHWGYINLFLSEYYLSTGDANVVAGINQYTIQLAQSQSMYGTFGHDPSPVRPDGTGRRSVGGYGPVNQCGLPANIAIVLGKKALLAAGQAIDSSIDPAIQRGSDFFAWYVNKGGAPYGEHQPVMAHASNGKDAECAVLFGIQDDSQPATSSRLAETEYFARMTVAGFPGREYGHTGYGFSYLWEALGANMGGPEAVARYLQQVRWSLDLERRTDGSFVYDGAEYSYDYYGAGTTEGGTYPGFSGCYYSLPGSGFITPTASYLLAYSLPLQRLYITGKNYNPAHTLASTKIDDALAAATYKQDCLTYTTTQLIAGLSEFDPLVRNYAATQLATLALSSAELTTLRGMVTGTDANGRMAACQALGLLKDAAALPLITQRLDKTVETNSWVRAAAANALRSYDTATASAQLTPMLTAFTANATDPDVIVWDDPIQLSNGYLGFALFGDTIYGWLVNGGANLGAYTINAAKSLLYPAVQAGLKQPDSYTRQGVADFVYNNLTLADVQALPLDLYNLALGERQVDRMWSGGSRADAIQTLAKFKFAEGIPVALAMLVPPVGFEFGSENYQTPALNALAGYGDAARWTLPTLRGYLTTWSASSSSYPVLVSAIASIEAATSPPAGITNLNAVATPQVVVTTGAKAITLAGTSPRGAVTFTNVTAPAHGALTGIPSNLTYTPTGGYSGPDSFTFQVTDSLTTSDPGTVSIIVGAAGSGLKGEYYDNMDFTNLMFTRTDAQVNFDWGTGSPDPSMGADTFSVRWSGLLLVPETGTYRFSTLNSDGVRLYVNGALVLDDFVDQATCWNDGASVNLTAGQLVDLQLEYYENTGPAVAKLKWTGPSFAGANGAVIGTPWLYDGTGMTRTPYAHAQSLTLMQNTAQAIVLTGSGGALTYTVVTPPAHGSLTGTAPNLTYTPVANYNGTDSFTFQVNNGTANSAPATVTLGIMAGLPVSYTWNSATSGNWSVAGNWTAGAPAAAGQPNYSLNFTPAGAYTVTQDLNSGFLLNQLNLAGAVTLAGSNSIAFAANGNVLPQCNQNSGSDVTFNIPLSLNAVTTFGGTGAGQTYLYGLLTGTGGMVKSSPGTLEITGLKNNTYSGGTVINSGNLYVYNVQGYQGLGTGTITLNGGVLHLDRANLTNNMIVNGGSVFMDNGYGSSLAGAITNNAGLAVEVWYVNQPLSGVISGPGGLTVTSQYGGQLVLSATNTYTGPSRVVSGTLSCSKAAALGAGLLNIGSGAKVALNYTGTRTIAGLSLGGTPMAAGSYGSTASPATNKNDTYFSGTGTVTAGAPNSAPVATPQSVSTAEDTAKPITLSASDADGNALTYAIVTPPAHGTLSGSAPTVTYAPMLHYNGSDSFTFKANDGMADSAPATITITVTPVNNAPFATPQSLTTAEDTPLPITLAGADVEGSALNFTVISQPAHGTLSGTAPNLTYLPAAYFHGTDGFTFKVNDGSLDSAPATVSITVTPVNHAPVATAQSVTTARDTAKAITLAGTDVDGNALSYAIVAQPAHGTLGGIPPYVTYTPATNYSGVDGFTFKVNDGALDSTPAAVTITVTPVNHPPVANFQSVTTATNTAKAITLTGSDAEGSALTYVIATQPAHGSLSGSAPNVTYTPATHYVGGDSFTFKANDGTVDSAPATVLLTVTSASQAITINAQVSAQSSGSVTINLTPEFLTSVNASDKLVVMTSGRGSGGSAWGKSLSGITYGTTNLLPAINVRSNDVKPTAGGEEVAGIFYLDNPGATPANTITISYAGVMDTSSGYTLLALSGTLPGVSVANGGVTPGVVMSGSTTLTTTTANSLVLAVGAADRATTTPLTPLNVLYTYSGGTYGAGSQTLATPGLVTPTFAYSDLKTTPVTVAAAFAPADTTPPTTAGSAIVDDKNGGPVATNTTVTYTVSFSKDMNAGTVSAADFGNAGTAAITIGTITEITPAVFSVPVTPTGTGTLQLQIQAGTVLTDVAGNALVTTAAIVDDTLITVTPPDTAPVATAQSVTTLHDSALPITLAATDAEGNALTYALVTAPAHGTLGGTAPNVTYTPATGYFGTDSFTFKANDGSLDSAPATVSITVMAASTTVLVSSPLATGPYGTTVTFTATVTAGATGTVTFSDGTTVLGSGALSSGAATFTIGALAVANHSVTATYGGDTTYAGSVSTPFAYGVTPLVLTLTGVTAADKVYDGGTAAALTGGALSGVINGETVTAVPGSATFASPNAGTWPVTATGCSLGGAHAGNYVLASQPTVPNATISARPVQLTGNVTRTYDATATVAASNLTVSNKISGDDLSLTGTAMLTAKDAGTQGFLSGFVTPVRVRNATGFSAASNSTSFAVTLGAAPASGNTLVAVISTRGTTANQVSGITSTGATWARATQSTNASGSTSEIWSAPVGAGAGTVVTISTAAGRCAAVVSEYSGMLAANALDQFNSASSSGSDTAPLTGTTAATSQTGEVWIGAIGYRASTPTLGTLLNAFTSVASAQSNNGTSSNNAKVYALERIVTATGQASSGGTLSATAVWSGAVATFKAASLMNLSLSGTSAANYTLSGFTGAVTIAPKALVLTATPAVTGKTYDGLTNAVLTGAALPGAETAGTGTPSDGKPYTGDTVALALSGTFDTKDAATGKAVTSSSTLGGAQAGDYTLTQPSGLTGAITPKALTLTATPAVTGKTYDGLAAAALTGSALRVAEAAGTGAAGDGAPYAGDTLTLGLSGTFNTKDVGSGKAVTSTSTLTGAQAGDYTLTQPTGMTGAIAPAALTVTADNQSKTYGQTLAFGSGATRFTSSGLQHGETVGSVTLACAGGDPAAAAGSYPITPGAATGGTFSAGNYTIGYVPGTLTVMTAYQTWAGGTAFDADPNHHGIANGLAWLLGAAGPSAGAGTLLPKPADEGGKLVLAFRCLKTANRGAALLKVQFSNDLSQPDQWTSHEAVVPDAGGTAGGVDFTITPDADPAFINVRAQLPVGAISPAGQLFGRLYASGE